MSIDVWSIGMNYLKVHKRTRIHINRIDLNIVTMRHVGSKYASVNIYVNIFKLLHLDIFFCTLLPLIPTRKRKVNDAKKCCHLYLRINNL